MRKITFRQALVRMLLFTTAGLGFSQPQSNARTPPPFDVASIKPNRSGSRSTRMQTSHGTLTASNVTLRMLIQSAFDVTDAQISGGPGWLNTECYDVAAKTERTDISDDDLWLSLQPLLADRFRLRFHRETRQLPVYALVIGKGGPRLRDHEGEGRTGVRFTMGSGKAKLEATKTSMPRFAGSLGGYVDRLVLDNTRLKGEYDFKLEWAQDHPGESSPSMLDSVRELVGLAGPSIFTAMQEQLGLKLQPTKGPVEMIVIDGAEKASGN